MAKSTYYYYLKNPTKAKKYETERNEIAAIFSQHKGRYGYRRIMAIMRNKGYSLNHKSVLKLMKSLCLKEKQSKNDKYHSYKGQKVADNHLNREFYAKKPFEKLTTDVTQFKIGNEKVYHSSVMDLYNREILSNSISLSPNFNKFEKC